MADSHNNKPTECASNDPYEQDFISRQSLTISKKERELEGIPAFIPGTVIPNEIHEQKLIQLERLRNNVEGMQSRMCAVR